MSRILFTVGGSSCQHPWGRLRGLAREGVSPGPHPGGFPGPHLGRGLQATPGGSGVSQPRAGGYKLACTEANTPLPQQTATAVGGMYPTGMHSCNLNLIRHSFHNTPQIVHILCYVEIDLTTGKIKSSKSCILGQTEEYLLPNKFQCQKLKQVPLHQLIYIN